MSEKNRKPVRRSEMPADTQAQRPVKHPKKKRGGGFFRFLRRTLLLILTLAVMLVAGLCIVINQILNGPSPAARDILVMSLTEGSATKWIPGVFLDKALVEQIRANVEAELPDDVTDTDQVIINKDSQITDPESEWHDHPDGIIIKQAGADTFNYHVMLIRDPSLVYMGTSTEGNFSRDIPGKRIDQAIEDEGAIAAINAGAFYDNGKISPKVGSTPEGLVVSKGKVRWTSGQAPEQGFAGFNQDNVLVVAKTMTADKATELGIRDGCCFGPVLIMNGEVNQEAYNSNSGMNPRTCIGQRADGTVIFLCMDGRQIGSLGGTYADAIDILVEYGAVNACNMDGGSSSIMLYRDSQGLFGEAGQVQFINNYSLLQKEPRRMPNYWMVRPGKEG